MQRKERIKNLLSALNKNLYERQEPIQLALLTAVAGESLFMLGAPGVAKSLIARKLKFAFTAGQSFEYLMNRFSTPDEVFGPVSIKKLKDEDKYERLTDKYLPGATVVFLDEIWKASPSIQNALLTVLNEKIYRNGEEEVKVELKGLIAASNELPPKNEGLEALWDRFLVRYMISEIKESGNFLQMLTSSEDVYKDTVSEELKITAEENELWSKEIDEIELPTEVLNTIQLVKKQLDDTDNQIGNVYFISDRRWKKVIRLLKTCAFLNGRKKVNLMDCFLITHCVWNQPEQLDKVRHLVSEVIRKHGYSISLNLTGLRQEIKELETEIEKETKVKHITTREELYPVEQEFYQVMNLETSMDGKYIKRADFDRLTQEESTINVYDDAFKLTYKVKAKKPSVQHQIHLFHNAQLLALGLRTHKVEKDEIIYRKPHQLIEKYWNEKLEELLAYVNENLQKLDTEKPEEWYELDQNLFVDARLAPIVKANLNDSINQLNDIQLKLEKLKYYYKNLEE